MKLSTTMYLYNCEPNEFCNMSYMDALKFKKEMAKKLHDKLYEEESNLLRSKNRPSYYDMADIRLRISKVSKAIVHNQKLIDEVLDSVE